MSAFIDFLAVTCRLPVFLAGQAAILVTRLILGLIFLQSGWAKIENFPKFVQQFTDWGFVAPTLNTAMAAGTEFGCGILLILGLGTRLAAALLAVTMLVATLTVHRSEVVNALSYENIAKLTDISPPTYLIFLLWLVGFGGGKIAVDRLVEMWWRRRRADQASAAAKA